MTYKDALPEGNLPSLTERRDQLILDDKCYNLVPEIITEQHNTINKCKLCIPNVRTNRYKNVLFLSNSTLCIIG